MRDEYEDMTRIMNSKISASILLLRKNGGGKECNPSTRNILNYNYPTLKIMELL
jgi:hypothetical protein